MTLVNGDILMTALAYARMGWSVIRIKSGTKRAAGKWTQYQSRRAQPSEIKSWFGNGSGFQLAAVLGEVSGGLVCRDFDDLAAYEAWAAKFPKLAKTLPTVATPRGRHVYFRAESLRSQTLADGEYRANGNYVLLPPSRHPSGVTYAWLVPLPRGKVPLVDPVLSGLLPQVPARAHTPPPLKADLAPSQVDSPRLTMRTQRFLKIGAAEGHRNGELFCAACDMAANNVSRREAEPQLLDGCRRCRPPYPIKQAQATIASAYSKPRNPARTADDPRGNYTIPRWLARRRDLKASDKLVWMALDYRQRATTDCFPSAVTIAKDTGLNRDTVGQSIKRLEKALLLTVRRTDGEVNHYTTHLPEIPSGAPLLATGISPAGKPGPKYQRGRRGCGNDSRVRKGGGVEVPGDGTRMSTRTKRQSQLRLEGKSAGRRRTA